MGEKIDASALSHVGLNARKLGWPPCFATPESRHMLGPGSAAGPSLYGPDLSGAGREVDPQLIGCRGHGGHKGGIAGFDRSDRAVPTSTGNGQASALRTALWPVFCTLPWVSRCMGLRAVQMQNRPRARAARLLITLFWNYFWLRG